MRELVVLLFNVSWADYLHLMGYTPRMVFNNL